MAITYDSGLPYDGLVGPVGTLGTELEAVNFILSTIGESPIDSLSSPQSADTVQALRALYQSLAEVLSEGWYFNTYENYTITADGSGYMSISETILTIWIDPSRYSSYDVVQRGLRLYDRRNQTYVFAVGTQLTFAATEQLDWTEIPPYGRWYIAAKAAHLFADRVMGATNVHAYIVDQEMRARATLMQADTDAGRYTLFNNQSVYRVIDRASNYTDNFYSQ